MVARLPSSKFAGRLREAIKASGRTIESIARAVGLSGRQSAHSYLTGRVEPTLNRVEQLAKVLRVDPRWLAGWQDKGGPPQSSREPLKDGEWQQAVQAFCRYSARRKLGVLPSDEKKCRALLRALYKRAKNAASRICNHGENLADLEVQIPILKLCHKVGQIVVLRGRRGVIAQLRICKGSALRMQVISSRD